MSAKCVLEKVRPKQSWSRSYIRPSLDTHVGPYDSNQRTCSAARLNPSPASASWRSTHLQCRSPQSKPTPAVRQQSTYLQCRPPQYKPSISLVAINAPAVPLASIISVSCSSGLVQAFGPALLQSRGDRNSFPDAVIP